MFFLFAFLDIFSLSSHSYFVHACLEDELDTAQREFQEWCKYNYNGFADGQRCYFVPNVADGVLANWYDAWQVCRNRGGTLAPVLTSSEWGMLKTKMLTKTGDKWVWTSGMRTVPEVPPDPAGGTCSYARNVTYYYKDESASGTKLRYDDTWLRTRKCNDDTGTNTHQCIHMWASYTNFGDLHCKDHKYSALCQVTARIEAYRRVDDVCVAETPLATYSADGPEACMDMCRKNDWCRSVNFKSNLDDANNTCELFPWWFPDQPKLVEKKEGCLPAYKSCVHFTYVPNVI
jgi:hypothetical protein